MNNNSILHKIINKKKKKIFFLKKYINLKNIHNISKYYLIKKKKILIKKKKIQIIAEIKKSSPSLGIIKEKFNPYKIAKKYINNKNIFCISILTEDYYFKGNYNYINQIKKNNFPILCKDFIINIYQIYEIFLWGANLILIILSIFKKYKKIINFKNCAKYLNMNIIYEIHNYKELKNLLKLNIKYIGINNRNLHTFKININTTKKIFSYIPNNKTIISESGYKKKKNINKIKKIGIYIYLIGEYFMKSNNFKKKLKKILIY